MNSSLKRIGAIFIKELQDIRTNTNVVVMYALPVIFALAYKHLIPDLPKGFSLGFSLLFLTVMVGMYVPSMIISEEKEKKTMNVLMLSPATPTEVFIGKGLLTFISIMFTALIMVLLSGEGFANMDVILIGTALTSIVCILLGMVVGMLAQNQMATGIYGLLIYLLFIMIPIFTMSNKAVLESIAKVFPTYHYFKMLELAFMKNLNTIDMIAHVGVIAGSVFIAFAVLLVFYHKKGLEQ